MMRLGIGQVGSWIFHPSVTQSVLQITSDLGDISQLSNAKNRAPISTFLYNLTIEAMRSAAQKLIKLVDMIRMRGAVTSDMKCNVDERSFLFPLHRLFATFYLVHHDSSK